MGVADTYKVDDLINTGNSVDLTYAKTSLHDNISDIKYIVKNIMYDYIDELLDIAVIINLTDKEYKEYKYRPKLLSYKLYGTTDLSFTILILNGLVSDKDFDLQKVKVVHPKNMDMFYDILDAERKYLLNKNVGIVSEVGTPRQLNISSDNDDGELLKIIQVLQKEIENIKNTILETITSIITEDIDIIINNIVNTQFEEIRQSINNIINNKLTNVETRLKELETQLANIDTLINTIIDSKLNDKLEALANRVTALENKSIPSDLAARLDQMRQDIDNLNTNMDLIISDKVRLILDQLLKDFEVASSTTRDVVINIGQPITLGLQRDTEFSVPYKGTFVKAQMSTRTDSIKTSNIIAILQIYNREVGSWQEYDKFNLNVDKQTDIFVMNTPIDKTPIRINIESGDMANVSGLTFVLSIKEDIIPEVPTPPTPTI